MKLSAIVITYNEEATIRRCLASLKFADEVIVIDSGSQDKTQQLAQEAGAHVIEHRWKGYGAQKNYGASVAHGEWVLFVDADEEVPEALQHDILTALNDPQAPHFYWLKIVTTFLGKPLRHLYGHNPRLFRKNAGRWTTAYVHEQVETMDGDRIHLGDTRSQILSTPLLHHSHPTIASYLESMHRYTDLDAQQMKDTGRHRSGRPVAPTWLLPWQLGARQFVKLLLYRRGILDGWAGIQWCALSGYYEFTMARKYIALCA